MTISIKQALVILGVSRTTLYRRMDAGTLQCTRSAEPQQGFEQTVTFSPEQLGLNEQQVQARLAGHDVPVHENYKGPLAEFAERPAAARPATPVAQPARQTTAPESEPNIGAPGAFAPHELSSTITQKEKDDLEFAERYKAGEATDSMGNSFTGNRSRPSGKISLLGPMEPRPKTKPSCTAHMNPALICDPHAPRVKKPWDDDQMELEHPGHLAKMEQMRADWGLRKPTQQETKQSNDIAAIAAAWRHGFSR